MNLVRENPLTTMTVIFVLCDISAFSDIRVFHDKYI